MMVTALLFGAAFIASPGFGHALSSSAAPVRLVPRPPPGTLSSPTIEFSELYRFGDRAPELTPKALALQGQRVTLVGFMVSLERAPRGGFYVSPYPAASDESGGGRGDLPPTSVLVLPRTAAGRPVHFVPGALEVTGILDVGNAETDGEPSTIRLVVDDARDVRFARTRRTANATRTTVKGERR